MSYISILIPVYNEEKYIAKCLDSVIQNDYPKNRMEVIVIDGGSRDATVEIVKTYQKKYPILKLLFNPRKIVPVSMNIGIREAKGDYIIRLDAHSSYPTNYFSNLIAWHQYLDADNIGVAIRTEVQNKTIKSKAIQKVLSHRFGVGNSDFRVGVDKVKEVDTVPFGCYKRETFEKYGYYNERLVRNQDIELNKRIIDAGGKIYIVPGSECTYYARESYMNFGRNQYWNGFWNILTAYYTKKIGSLSLRHFVPMIFLLSLIIPLVFSLVYFQAFWLGAFSLASYFILVIIISLRLKEKWVELPYLMWGFLTLHFSYGLGSLAGLFTVIKKMIKGEK